MTHTTYITVCMTCHYKALHQLPIPIKCNQLPTDAASYPNKQSPTVNVHFNFLKNHKHSSVSALMITATDTTITSTVSQLIQPLPVQYHNPLPVQYHNPFSTYNTHLVSIKYRILVKKISNSKWAKSMEVYF